MHIPPVRYTTSDIEVGDYVTINMWGGGTRSGTVTGVEEDVKNGRPGLVYDNDTGEWWAYLDQVEHVRKA